MCHATSKSGQPDNKQLEAIVNWFTRQKLLLTGRKAPIFWGNRHWYDLETLVSHGSVPRLHFRWIDYRSLPEGDTSKLLVDGHPQAPYRRRFNTEILDRFVAELEEVPRSERVCLFTSGGTASGKTSAVDEITGNSETNISGGIRIDYDRIKKILPEYELMIALGIREAATYVQAESGKLGARLFKKACQKGAPIIFEQTLENAAMPLEYIKGILKKNGYTVVVVATHVSEGVGQDRARVRAAKIGRYVDPQIISRIYKGVPSALFEIRNKVDKIFLFDNSGTELRLMFTKDRVAGSVIVDQNLYNDYLVTVGHSLDLNQ